MVRIVRKITQFLPFFPSSLAFPPLNARFLKVRTPLLATFTFALARWIAGLTSLSEALANIRSRAYITD
jgi:hypothetical protein